MTSVKFFYCNNMMVGFELNGHSTVNENDELGKLVCTAISSAVYLTANTLTDVLNCKCNIKESDGYFKLMLLNNEDTNIDIFFDEDIYDYNGIEEPKTYKKKRYWKIKVKMI